MQSDYKTITKNNFINKSNKVRELLKNFFKKVSLKKNKKKIWNVQKKQILKKICFLIIISQKEKSYATKENLKENKNIKINFRILVKKHKVT